MRLFKRKKQAPVSAPDPTVSKTAIRAFLLGLESRPIQAFAFRGREEALRHRVVETAADRAARPDRALRSTRGPAEWSHGTCCG
jgi:hypothetical protein